VASRMCFAGRWRKGWTRPRQWAPRRSFSLIVISVAREVWTWYLPRRGYYAYRWRRRDVPNAQWHDYPFTRIEMKKKTAAAAPAPGDGPKHLAPMESTVFTRLHHIVAHCAVSRYDDGDPRRPGWITIQTLGSAWKVMIKDPDGCCQMSAIGNTLDDARALADLLLSSEDAPWEPDPFLKRQDSGKKK